MKFRYSMLAVLPIALSAGLAVAAEPVQQQNSNAVWFENWAGLSNATMRISSPAGQVSEIHASSGTPVFQLPTGEIPDGIWRYEVTAATDEQEKILNPINNGRGDDARDTSFKSYYVTGYFVVERGVIIRPTELSEDAAGQDQ